jgi:hypothetical protein
LDRKKWIWLIILLAVFAAAFYAYKEYNRGNPDMKEARADFILSAGQVVNEFESDDRTASEKYNGKTLELTGKIRSIEKDEDDHHTIVLGERGSLSSTRCAMDTTYHLGTGGLAEGSSITVRGVCTGYNKDEMGLGSDLILNRAVITKHKD